MATETIAQTFADLSTTDLSSGRATPRPVCTNGNGSCSHSDGGDIEELACPVSDKTFTADRSACPSGRAGKPTPTSVETMQEIDPLLIRVSLEDRVRYLKDFVGFGVRDQEIIKMTAPIVSAIINDTVERLYANLFEFDITKKVFLERNDGFDGEIPERLEDLKLNSPQLIYRKVFMRTWCRRVLTADYSNPKIWTYMDKVGVMHTGAKPFKHKANVKPLHVPYRDCALTLGWLQNVLHTAILSVPDDQLSTQDKIAAVTAFNKVLWIQNDLFARHYIPGE